VIADSRRRRLAMKNLHQGVDAKNEGRTIADKVVKERLRAKGFNV